MKVRKKQVETVRDRCRACRGSGKKRRSGHPCVPCGGCGTALPTVGKLYSVQLTASQKVTLRCDVLVHGVGDDGGFQSRVTDHRIVAVKRSQILGRVVGS